ncbi:MAG: hypothetical protein EYC62_02570 [Alphaproteobacteria bacterium]|nr:MAG: hypothetical protein EYC62_02570 [Alphaproteobacteria bacterium]
MPTITEAHVVLVKNQQLTQQNPINDDDCLPTPWEEFLEKHGKVKPQRFQVHLVVSGFSEREDARGFAENFMSCGSMFVFNNKKRNLYRLEVEADEKQNP